VLTLGGIEMVLGVRVALLAAAIILLLAPSPGRADGERLVLALY